ncbi:MAG: EFR1 family ferrodoxin [Defluviitaleaceae bacterium]|nr:EFR1 family ferrodoxin [Defluviitaleaceae bacterium]
MTIFYFTGTGNSLFAAKRIADAAGARLVSIPQVIRTKETYTDDCIGFVYPQYANGLPKMVRAFIEGNTFKADYFFAVDLWSFIHINALGEIAGLVPLDYSAYLKTPNNFIYLFGAPKDPAKPLAKTKKRLEIIIKDIIGQKRNRIKPRKTPGNATKYFGKSGFSVTSACTQCGICAKVCPAGNIRLDSTGRFGTECELCYGCVNACPPHAIFSKKAELNRRQYKNPLITVNEIIEANKK